MAGWARVQPRTPTTTAPAVASHIHKFVEENDVAGLQEVLDQGTEGINTLDAKGKAPLHTACELGYLQIAQELLVNGADCKVVTSPEGLNALHLLAKCVSFDDTSVIAEVAELILDAGIDVDCLPNPPGHLGGKLSVRNIATPLSVTPLGMALSAGKPLNDPLVELLLVKGAIPDSPSLRPYQKLLQTGKALQDLRNQREEFENQVREAAEQIEQLAQQRSLFESRIRS